MKLGLNANYSECSFSSFVVPLQANSRLLSFVTPLLFPCKMFVLILQNSFLQLPYTNKKTRKVTKKSLHFSTDGFLFRISNL